ncbi:MAG TPA: hypothetical protein VNL38_01480 [Candidatus Nitrosotenuis sp.]|nr:hypothetical protein [Candidatus Nitrosotenuis sp.]
MTALTSTEKFNAVTRALERLGEIEYLVTRDAATWLVMKHEHLCALCGEKHFLFVNRDGRTRCWSCDEKDQSSAASASSAVKSSEVNA